MTPASTSSTNLLKKHMQREIANLESELAKITEHGEKKQQKLCEEQKRLIDSKMKARLDSSRCKRMQDDLDRSDKENEQYDKRYEAMTNKVVEVSKKLKESHLELQKFHLKHLKLAKSIKIDDEQHYG